MNVDTWAPVIAALAGVALAWFLTERSEARRAQRDDDRRWQSDRFRVISQLQAELGGIDRILDDAMGFHQTYKLSVARGERSDDLATAMLEKMTAAAARAESRIEVADLLLGELRLLLEGPCVESARNALFTFWDVTQALGRLKDETDIKDHMATAREHTQKMIKEARNVLTGGSEVDFTRHNDS